METMETLELLIKFKYKNMKTEKQNAIKKLLAIDDKQLEELQEKVLEDWANNVISTKYREAKTTEQIVDEINETNIGAGTVKKTGRAKK